MKWNDLTMRERSDLMSLFLKAGVGSLSDMKRIYDEDGFLENNFTHKYSGEENNDSGIFKDLYNWAKNKYNEIFSKNKTTRFKRILENDSPTKQLSEEYEDMVNEAMKNSTIIDKNYTPYIKDKEIVIPKVGRASTNMLDSLAKYSAVVGLPVSDAIGLAARETKFGAQPNIFVGYPSDYPSMESFNENNRAIMNMSYARNFGGIPSAYLLNDEAWYNYDTPHKSMQNFVSKTGSPFEHALYYFKTGNYNRGEKGYNNTVKQLGKQIFNTPVIQQWWKESEYNPQNKHDNGGWLFNGEGSAVSNKKDGFLENSIRYKYPDGGDIEVYGGEIAPAVVKPSPVFVDLVTYPISKAYKISHSALFSNIPIDGTQSEIENFKPLTIDKRFDATYNLLTNNCSDYTGRFLENALHLKGLTKGITTPKGLSNKIRKYAYEGDINMVEYPSEGNGKSKYTVQNIEIPWYDYRKAEDIARQQLLEDLIQNNKQLSPKRISKLRERYNKDFPKLQYYIDDKGNVVHERNSF